jgi:hypothetical protein
LFNPHILPTNSGRTVDVALWGTHATTFDGEELYKYGQSESLIVLLVGTLIKSYRGIPAKFTLLPRSTVFTNLHTTFLLIQIYAGRETISCGEAAKIYINPEIPEKTEYCERSVSVHL